MSQSCRKCGSRNDPSEHHIWPKRWSWQDYLADTTTTLCHSSCHVELEWLIALFERKGSVWCLFCDLEQLPATFYSQVLDWYLRPEVNSALVRRVWGIRQRGNPQKRATLPIEPGLGLAQLCERYATGRGCLEASVRDNEVALYWRRRWGWVSWGEINVHLAQGHHGLDLSAARGWS